MSMRSSESKSTRAPSEILPPSGRANPAMQFRVVVFPPPDGPRIIVKPADASNSASSVKLFEVRYAMRTDRRPSLSLLLPDAICRNTLLTMHRPDRPDSAVERIGDRQRDERKRHQQNRHVIRAGVVERLHM